MLLHGWPDSVLRFERLLPLLDDVDVIVPALPGFPFSLDRPASTSVDEAARLVADAVTSLGYDRFVVSGGDVGGDVAEILARTHPKRVAAMHLTNVSPRHAQAADPGTLPPDARDYLTGSATWFRTEGGYIAEQSTRPSTLLTALGDSPAGLAAWILDKIIDWSEDATTSFSTDDLLTWVSSYWFTGTIGSSFSTYAEPRTSPTPTNVPTVVSSFPSDIKPAPRSFIETVVHLRAHIEHDKGGHFAAWEEPAAYEHDLRIALSLAGRQRPAD